MRQGIALHVREVFLGQVLVFVWNLGAALVGEPHLVGRKLWMAVEGKPKRNAMAVVGTVSATVCYLNQSLSI